MGHEITIAADGGFARAFHFPAPKPTPHGVVIFMDMFGVRPALLEMGARLAGLGYNVLLPDLYYRHADYGTFVARDTQRDPARLEVIRAIRDATPMEMTVRDAPHFIEALAGLGATGRIGLVGYCMGGGRALRAAAAAPDRVGAVASFHGGRLAVAGDPESPHGFLDALGRDTRVYVGSAGEDASFPPEQSALLIETLHRLGFEHAVETFASCRHGWTVPDSAAFNPAGAERHWRRLETVLGEALV